MGDIDPAKLAIYIYEFHVKKQGKDYLYAVISEIYSPDYLTLENLRQIVEDGDRRLKKTKFIEGMLGRVRDKLGSKWEVGL